MNKTILITLLAAIFAAAEPKTASEPSPAPPSPAKSSARAAAAPAVSEILAQNLVLDAGKSVRIVAKGDFSGADRATFGLYSEPAVNITKVRLSVWWGVPNAQFYTTQDVIRGSNFPYTNTGGGNVAVGGPSLFIDVNNDGDAAVTIAQISVYAQTR